MIPLWFRRRRYLRFTRHVAGAIRRRLVRVVAVFMALFGIHVAVMMIAEGFSLNDALWLTITTATTVGYGDLHADTPLGRLATVLCMYVFGIFLLAQAASDLFDYRALLRERRRRGEFKWRNMKDHLLVVNVPAYDADAYLARLVDHVRRSPALDDVPIQILTPAYPEGLPAELVDAGVTHYTGVAENSANLNAANVAGARYVIIIADEPNDVRSDAHTYDILTRIAPIRSQQPSKEQVIVAEVVEDADRERILAAGATAAVRPIRAYPELVVRALTAPGVEQVLENLFTHDTGRLARFDANFDGLRWSDLVVSFVTGGAGVPMGYIGERGVNTNPHPSDTCSGRAIITLIDDRLDVTAESVAKCLAAAGSNLSTTRTLTAG